MGSASETGLKNWTCEIRCKYAKEWMRSGRGPQILASDARINEDGGREGRKIQRMCCQLASLDLLNGASPDVCY